MGSDSYDDAGRRPFTSELSELGMEATTEVASWKMPLQYFVRTYPHGKVFINDYKEYPDPDRPVLTLYDKIMDLVFCVAINLLKNQWWGGQFIPTVEHVEDRLKARTRVWGFNIQDDYVTLTEGIVREKGNRNMMVGETPIHLWRRGTMESLGIWKRPSSKPVTIPSLSMSMAK